MPTLLVDRPIVYDIFNKGQLDKYTFLELEMKDGNGFYSGLLAEYAIVADNEPHKLLYLEQIQFKQTKESDYAKLNTDGMLVDLADVVTTKVASRLREVVENDSTASSQ